MSRIGLAAIVLVAVTAGDAQAEAPDAQDLYRRVEALVQSLAGALIGGSAPDREVITPPGDTDPRMAVVPPSSGTMRTIAPPGKFRQQ
jgi:hypothetical protein